MRRHPSWDAPQTSPPPATRSPHGGGFVNLMDLSLDDATEPQPPSASTLTTVASMEPTPRRLPSLTGGNRVTSFVGTGGTTTSVPDTVPPSTTTGVGPEVKKKRIRLKTERRREQCRRNQARYRNKQKLSALQLENTVDQLRQEVEQLQQHHESLHRTPTRRVDVEELVHQLYQLFRFGMNVGRDDSRFVQYRDMPALEDQVGFVTSTFHPDVLVGDVQGRTYFLEQLRRFATLFDDQVATLERTTRFARSEVCESIQSTAIVEFAISMNTLRYVFPHLVRAEHHQIRWKLLGQRLRCANHTVLAIGECGRVVEINWTIDWIAAFQTVLTIEETAVVLSQAHIERDAYLTVTGEDVPTSMPI